MPPGFVPLGYDVVDTGIDLAGSVADGAREPQHLDAGSMYPGYRPARISQPGGECGHAFLDERIHLRADEIRRHGRPGRLHRLKSVCRQEVFEKLGVGGMILANPQPHLAPVGYRRIVHAGRQQEVHAEGLVGEFLDPPDAAAHFLGIEPGAAEEPHSSGVADGGDKLRRRRKAPHAHAGLHDRIFDPEIIAQSGP